LVHSINQSGCKQEGNGLESKWVFEVFETQLKGFIANQPKHLFKIKGFIRQF